MQTWNSSGSLLSRSGFRRPSSSTLLVLEPEDVLSWCSFRPCCPSRPSRPRFAAGHPAQQVLHLAAEDEVALAKQLLRACLIEVGEENLRLGRHLAIDQDTPQHRSALRAKVLDFCFVDQLLAGQHLAVEDG